MAKSSNQKLKLLYIRQFLLEHSDEEHPVTVGELIVFLAEHGIEAERKSVYADVQALQEFGMDILQKRGPAGGYYVGSREFELPELRLLVDAVQSSKFITESKTVALIKKIEGLASVYEARSLQRQVVVRGRIKSMDESIYYRVDDLHAAISEDRRIRFRYYEYTIEKKRVFRHDGAFYEVSPFALLWDNENYYLIAYDDEAEKIKHFRVDKLAEIEKTELPRGGRKVFESLDLGAYTKTHFRMFSGEEQRIVLEFRNTLIGVVLDRFGQDAAVIPWDEEHFRLQTDIAVSPQFFGWLSAYGDGARIVSPQSVADEYRAHIAGILRLYEPGEIKFD